jgi:hypothetical protein
MDSMGSVFAMCHQLIVADPLALLPLPPQAPRTIAPAPAPARPNNDRREMCAVVVMSRPFQEAYGRRVAGRQVRLDRTEAPELPATVREFFTVWRTLRPGTDRVNTYRITNSRTPLDSI